MVANPADGKDPLVGRDAELAVLVDRLECARTGCPTTVLVAGEPGMGKTRLVDELARVARSGRIRVVRSDAEEGDGAPFGLWAGVRQALGRGSAMEDTGASTGPDGRWERLDLIASLVAGAAPVVIVLEDIHWADASSLWLLERLGGWLAAAPALVVATTRDGDAAITRHADAVVRLAGLDAAATGRLMAAARTEGSRTPEEMRDLTGGNPLFIRELIALGGGAPSLPRPVSDVLNRQLALLPPGARHAVGVLAVAGYGVALTVVAQAAGISPAQLLDDLRPAEAAGVVRFHDGGRVRFAHDLLRAAATATLPRPNQRALHLALASALGAGHTTTTVMEAVRHRLAALPAGDAATAATAAIDAMGRLRASGEHAAAAEVGLAALAPIETADVALALQARVAVDLADVLAHLGDQSGATAFYERAAALAVDVDDVLLRIRAEVGACRYAIPFVPDPGRTARLEDLDRRLPPGDAPMRVLVRGRLAVLAAAAPGGLRRAHGHGDAAVAMARRLGDPLLLADALADRHFTPIGPDGLRARDDAAAELVGLGARLGRPDVALRGLEWQFSQRVELGDQAGAAAALGRFELDAEIVASPYWRYAARVRRAALAMLQGDRSAALRTIDQATQIGSTVVDVPQLTGLEVTLRFRVALLWRLPDERLAALLERTDAMVGSVEVPFLKAHLAMAALALGDPTRALAAVHRYGPSAPAILESIAGPATVIALAQLAAAIGDLGTAPVLRATLEPYADRLGLGNGTSVHVPIADTLGQLAILQGDLAGAVALHHQACDVVRAVGAPVMLATCAANLATALDAAGDTVAAATARADAHRAAVDAGMAPAAVESGQRPDAQPRVRLQRLGGAWRIVTLHGEAVVDDSLGMAQLARLVALPGVAIGAAELAGHGGAPAAHDLGPALDARAKREYRRRITDLRAEVDEAERYNDPARAEAAAVELDAVMAELRRAVGLGGRDRPVGEEVERARVNVTRSLRRAVATIALPLPELGAHLERSIRTGRECRYDPEPATALRWEVDARSP